MSFDHSILSLILEASIVVQVVMGLLLLVSLISWAIIFVKSSQISKARRSQERFEKRFWSGVSLDKLYDDLSATHAKSGLEKMFFSGFHEFLRARHTGGGLQVPAVVGAQRAMRVAESRELEKLENNLSFLATVGSTSPYVGLFGTVWGIMNSFLSLGQMQQASLAVVAPGIAEALIATAMGLFAAIPAVIAYNKFSDGVDRVATSYENFREEFTTLLERNNKSSGV
ncbi:protein TolQ [Leucothrix arctica]|uniref:Tol-Pal system protein TolQ n=1 Tax=Leucothrix arctica TaxID=1481894 RepID=A0A317CB58_9GAMM|nr:protein TolQ [Leucothrix arctica]PWQ94553.1 protein TolQ [Leucothrix arctica]